MPRHTMATVIAMALLAVAPALAESPGPISEETPPATCDPGAFVIEVRCTGDYCDNMAIRCGRIAGATLGAAMWTPFVSEENGGTRSCPPNHYIAGLACNGRYCDNVSLYCVEATNVAASNCQMTRKVSEEGGGRLFLGEGIVDAAGQRIAARAMKCTGDYCDNMSFEVCEITGP